MTLDPYAVCPCGSGKKFKWCCQPVHEEIDNAYRQQDNGQHESALRIIDEVVRTHPNKPEAWGRKAHLLHLNNRNEEAEKALEEAFKLDANYAFGWLLQGMFRAGEGEPLGAAVLYRKAVELYPIEAEEQRAFLYNQIGQFELSRNHVVAARYAWQFLLRYQPDDQEFMSAWDTLYGGNSRMPEVARKEYAIQGTEPKRPPAWKEAVMLARTGKLNAAQKAFEELAKAPKGDPLAWYNLGLVRAWQGNNRAAIEALDRFVATEREEAKAVEAWALAEVLRLSAEMIGDSDHVQNRILYQFREVDGVSRLLSDWDEAGRLVSSQVDQERGILRALVLDEVTQLVGAAAPSALPIGAYVTIVRNTMSLSHPNLETLTRFAGHIDERLRASIVDRQTRTDACQFGDVVSEALTFPRRSKPELDFVDKLRERATQFFEDIWAHRPSKALSGNSPIDAAGHAVLRRKVLGQILFLQQCFAGGIPGRLQELSPDAPPVYDFNRLRHKLGLDAAAPPPPSAQIDFTALSAADLAALDLEPLTLDELDKAFRAAVKLDAGELATRFVRTIVGRPADPSKSDLFPFYKFLIDQAQSQANWDQALAVAVEGEGADAERNQGRRRSDYELRRGQLYAKRGDADKADEVFHQLIARVPHELKYRGSAAEAMLSLRKGAKAMQYADAGLVEARKSNNRDMEAYFLELVAAAKKQGG